MTSGQHHAIPMRNHRILSQLKAGISVDQVADEADLTVGYIAYIAREAQYQPKFAPPADGALSERDQFILGRAREGETFTAIARDYGISRERVRQIVQARSGLGARTGLADQRAKRAFLTATARAEELIRDKPDATAKEIGDESGLDTDQVRRLMGIDEALRRQRPRQIEPDITDQDLWREMRRVAGLPGGNPLTSNFYDENRAPGTLGSVRITQRHQTWRLACAKAGVSARRPPRSTYSRKWSEDQMLDWVSDYLDSTDNPSYARFGDWLKGQPGAPSSQTVRNSLGNWTTILHKAVDHRQANGHRPPDSTLGSSKAVGTHASSVKEH